MRSERVRRIQAPVQAPSLGRALRAANDNQPDVNESVVSILIGRSLIVGAVVLAMVVVATWSFWLGRAVWRHFT